MALLQHRKRWDIRQNSVSFQEENEHQRMKVTGVVDFR